MSFNVKSIRLHCLYINTCGCTTRRPLSSLCAHALSLIHVVWLHAEFQAHTKHSTRVCSMCFTMSELESMKWIHLPMTMHFQGHTVLSCTVTVYNNIQYMWVWVFIHLSVKLKMYWLIQNTNRGLTHKNFLGLVVVQFWGHLKPSVTLLVNRAIQIQYYLIPDNSNVFSDDVCL